jgi:hypothetical protein
MTTANTIAVVLVVLLFLLLLMFLAYKLWSTNITLPSLPTVSASASPPSLDVAVRSNTFPSLGGDGALPMGYYGDVAGGATEFYMPDIDHHGHHHQHHQHQPTPSSQHLHGGADSYFRQEFDAHAQPARSSHMQQYELAH